MPKTHDFQNGLCSKRLAYFKPIIFFPEGLGSPGRYFLLNAGEIRRFSNRIIPSP